MKTELQIFTDLAWQDKITYMVSFYQGMIKKTTNPSYIEKFQAKIDEIQGYEASDENTQKLIVLYERIMEAKKKTKQRRIEASQKAIEEQKAKIARIQAGADEEDPDEYLAQALTQC